jgi:hypothetical protein
MSSSAPHRRRRTVLIAALALAAVGAVVAAVLYARHGAGVTSFASATANTRAGPPFPVRRTRRVSSESALRHALSTLRPGDRIVAAKPFRVEGEVEIAARLPPPGAVVDLGTGSSAVLLDSGSDEAFPAVWIHDTTNLRLVGGDISNPKGGDGIDISGPTSNVTWWRFSIHDVGGSGLGVFPAHGPTVDLDLEGRVVRWGLLPERDPHREKGTGLHAAILADVEGGVFARNRIAIDAEDGPGDAIELGNPTSAGEITGNTIILSASRLNFRARHSTVGNGLQLWGGVPIDAKVLYLVTSDTEGRAVNTNAVSQGVSKSRVEVVYGRSFGCCKNPNLSSTEPEVDRFQAWDPRFGVRYLDVRSSK